MRVPMRLTAAVALGIVVLSSPTLTAQDGIMADLRDREYNNVMNNLIDIVQKMPLDQFAHKPAPQLRTFGEVVGHIMDVQFRLCGAVLPEPAAATSWEKESDPRKLVQGFWNAVTFCDRAFDGMTETRAAELVTSPRGTKLPRTAPLVAMLGHTSRETGKLVTYLRLKGIEPPPTALMRGRNGRPARLPVTE